MSFLNCQQSNLISTCLQDVRAMKVIRQTRHRSTRVDRSRSGKVQFTEIRDSACVIQRKVTRFFSNKNVSLIAVSMISSVFAFAK